MNRYRITKYNPKNRDESGNYLRDEWTSISDIGKKYGDELFTINEYLETEKKYKLLVGYLIEKKRITSMIIDKCEKYYSMEEIKSSYKSYRLNVTDIEIKVFNEAENGKELKKKEEVLALLGLVLRENIWAQLRSCDDNFVLNCGYDYYMYIDVKEELDEIDVMRIDKMGLYVENMINGCYHEMKV